MFRRIDLCGGLVVRFFAMGQVFQFIVVGEAFRQALLNLA